MSSFSVSFLVAAKDESVSLEKTVDFVMENCDKRDIDKIIIVIPSTAAPECLETIEKLEKRYPENVVRLVQKRPHLGGAIHDAADFAVSTHVMLLSADMSVDLRPLPDMIDKEKQNPGGIVKTSRWLKKGSFFDYPKLLLFANASAQAFLRLLYGAKLTDMTAPVQIMPLELYRKIDWKEQGYAALPELILCPLRLGAEFIEVPAECYQRTEGSSGNSLMQRSTYLKTALRIRFTKPQKLLK